MVLAKSDLDALRDVIGVAIDRKLEQKLDEKFGLLPTKKELYERTDMILRELRVIKKEIASTLR